MYYRKKRGEALVPGRKRRIFNPKETEQEPAVYYTRQYQEDTPRRTTTAAHSHFPAQPAYEPDELEAGSRIAAITRRYNGIPMPDGVMVRRGNEQIYVHKGAPPIQRASRIQAQNTEQSPLSEKQYRRGRFHWLLFLGLVLAVMVLGFIVLNALGSWWHIHQDDSTYGRPRTFQIDAVVGHSDSAAHPSHFIALNLNSHIIIIEIPGGDIAKSIIYSGGVLVGDSQELTPVTLSFSDVNGDGKPDMLVHVSDQTLTFLNNGTKFVPPSTLVTNGEGNLPNLEVY